jgi:hypothetical protein
VSIRSNSPSSSSTNFATTSDLRACSCIAGRSS